MKDRIIEMLERGERVDLKLADKMGFIEQGASHLVADGLQRGINTVCNIDSDNNVVVRASGLDNMLIVQSDDYLKYFKIKEPTFNDLIEVAKKAVQDDILSSFTVNDMDYSDLIGRAIYIGLGMRAHRIANEIKRIQSLYTETFVIESEEDIKRVKKGAVVTLANGNAFDVALSTQLGRGWVLDTRMNELGQHQTYCMFVLKGATVTQKER